LKKKKIKKNIIIAYKLIFNPCPMLPKMLLTLVPPSGRFDTRVAAVRYSDTVLCAVDVLLSLTYNI